MAVGTYFDCIGSGAVPGIHNTLLFADCVAGNSAYSGRNLLSAEKMNAVLSTGKEHLICKLLW